ncbi:ATP-dependent helicase HrpB [Aporhodopirellula aestuarii]|uniref:ATP-dependent helicase HrpB n=1 Tax=Aporhodopirellula aestuarii TaxID=2950107 RepID=A0ABT0UD61_9BACT|nr:ATP-dependent helicase HrpB [Aporhodopirellula aestuarii]MCM2374318.1 ATP-dependent helicase HrpB [Aporhodopirellula aestuarii]
MKRPSLPIDEILPQLIEAIAAGNPVVLKAPPGAGKTTGVPLALHGASGIDDGQIWVVQPRRLAARSVAEFLARKLGEPIGQTIGYHVRLDRKETEATRVLLMTTGIFLQRMQFDPLLEKTSCVILDEFHERSLELDLALAMTQRLRTQLRDELRMIVMSATLDPQPIASFLGPAARSLECSGRSYPVEISHHETNSRERLEHALTPLIVEAARQTVGHVLVFLPGLADIHRVGNVLRGLNLENTFSIVPLHGSLTPMQQDAAIANDPTGPRKIILSTNIAETSVTVEGVTTVVDSGLAKIPMLDSRLGLTRLQTEPISIASADQRAGRAGRTAPGVCYRMWSVAAHRTRDAFDAPEISRGDLSASVLALANLGEQVDGQFPWLTPPPEHAIEAATRLLVGLGALDDSGRITPLGRTLSRLPLHPRIARFAVAVAQSIGTAKAAAGAALLSERDPLENEIQGWSDTSLAEKIRWIDKHPRSTGRSFQSIVRQVKRSLEHPSLRSSIEADDSSNPRPVSDGEAVAQAILAAYPDRVVMRRPGDEDRGVMVGRRGVFGLSKLADIDRTSKFLLCYDVDGSATESRVRGAVEIDESWLPETGIVKGVDVDFDPERETIVCRATRRYIDLVLSETPVACEANEATAERLYRAAVLRRERVMPDATPGKETDFDAALHRIRLVLEYCYSNEESPQGNVDNLWSDVCKELCHGRRSFAELRRAPWKDHLVGLIGYEFWQKVQNEAPTHLTLPSGNRVQVGYSVDRPPWIEAKIQECFGWPRTPRILGGKVSVQMHLLGPNRRPQQITEDLESFWRNTYQEIRKELRRRYPKHHWPEDPMTAKATHNGLKPRV